MLDLLSRYSLARSILSTIVQPLAPERDDSPLPPASSRKTTDLSAGSWQTKPARDQPAAGVLRPAARPGRATEQCRKSAGASRARSALNLKQPIRYRRSALPGREASSGTSRDARPPRRVVLVAVPSHRFLPGPTQKTKTLRRPVRLGGSRATPLQRARFSLFIPGAGDVETNQIST